MKKSILAALAIMSCFTLCGCILVVKDHNQYSPQATESAPAFQETSSVSEAYPATPQYVEEVQYVDEGDVNLVINFNEPCYLPPPIPVAYHYDYYVYERHGDFVNVVFYQGGHRTHSEVWRNGGKRMTYKNFADWKRHQRYPAEKMRVQQRMLAEKHKIHHDDKHFGLKPPQARRVAKTADPKFGNKSEAPPKTPTKAIATTTRTAPQQLPQKQAVRPQQSLQGNQSEAQKHQTAQQQAQAREQQERQKAQQITQQQAQAREQQERQKAAQIAQHEQQERQRAAQQAQAAAREQQKIQAQQQAAAAAAKRQQDEERKRQLAQQRRQFNN